MTINGPRGAPVTTPEALAQVIAGACREWAELDETHETIRREFSMMLARAVLAHLGEGREHCPSCVAWSEEVDDLLARLDVAIVQMRDYVTVQEDRNRWCEKVGALQAEARAQAAAHAEDVRKLQVRMLKVVGALRKIYEGQNCVCKLNPYVGGPVPCETCQLGALLAEADGR